MCGGIKADGDEGEHLPSAKDENTRAHGGELASQSERELAFRSAGSEAFANSAIEAWDGLRCRWGCYHVRRGPDKVGSTARI